MFDQTPVGLPRAYGWRPAAAGAVLRAGLGMADAALALLRVVDGFVGLARDEETYQPRAYMESLPPT